jgi:hypothetical protein
MEERKFREKIKVSSQLLEQHVVEGDNFLHSNVTGDESCFRRFDWERKPQRVELHHRISSKKKNPKTMS